MTAHLLRRSWLVALFAAAAAAIAWAVVHDNPKTYERTIVFAVLPSAVLENQDVPEALRALADPNAGFTGTMAGALGSAELLGRAVTSVLGTRPEAEEYKVTAAARPGSDILEARLRGPDPAALAAIDASLTAVATRWVSEKYRAYSLARLSSEASTGPVAPRTFETTGLAFLLGAVVALAAAYLEGAARGRLHRPALAVGDGSDKPVHAVAGGSERAASAMADGSERPTLASTAVDQSEVSNEEPVGWRTTRFVRVRRRKA